MNDWKARAEREANAILAGWFERRGIGTYSHEDFVNLVATAWMQGANFATHLDLQALEMGADDLKAAL